MANTLIGIEDLPTSRFHKRIALVAAGGPFCDGYLLGIIVVALPFIAQDLALNALQIGLVGAASLVGMFVGGVVFGPMTDRFGRQKMYVLNLAVFVICSLAHLVVEDVTALFVLRFVMGIALGADYPIATALAAEFLPRKLRGPVLASLVLLLWVGYTLSLATGLLVSDSPSSVWRYILASAAIPSMIFLLLRLNVPESPRWLISAGRTEDARRVVAEHLGKQVDFAALVAETRVSTSRRGLGLSSIRELLARGYGRMLVFCSIFWMCQIAPSFAIKTFQPMLLKSLGVTQPLAGSLVIISFAIVGTAIGMFIVNRVGRRTLCLASFVLATLALFLLGTPMSGIAAVAIGLFILFTMAEAAGSGLQFIYPNEIFPTDLRATGMGLAMSASRIGAAAGTFLLPTVLTRFGSATGLMIAGGISLVGLLLSVRMAPETRDVSLGGEQATPGVSAR
ncbi:MFS transporter [Cupriavidus taiwanensis]|uniref:Major facilitator superfamily MFS_1 n=1 Tax=Cupriavidus taiwanensis TaxID=164546 RepID=A0A375CCN8_9BURK|nr:MFS transporter [Cupriavidus taiwanensis]NSX16581.1 MFS transporter [Cupriavidus taiwanensis]SOY67852.1 Major facilitator superfamily MFS_1 [Cupriavidus taiwanensis]